MEAEQITAEEHEEDCSFTAQLHNGNRYLIITCKIRCILLLLFYMIHYYTKWMEAYTVPNQREFKKKFQVSSFYRIMLPM